VGERGLLRVASNYPKHSTALGGDCRDPGQCGDLLRYLLDWVTVARLFGEEEDNLSFVVRSRRTIGCASGIEIGRLSECDTVVRLG
jgi:hypothetical protein